VTADHTADVPPVEVARARRAAAQGPHPQLDTRSITTTMICMLCRGSTCTRFTYRRPPADVSPLEQSERATAQGPHHQLDARSITTTAINMARECWGPHGLRCPTVATWCCVSPCKPLSSFAGALRTIITQCPRRIFPLFLTISSLSQKALFLPRSLYSNFKSSIRCPIISSFVLTSPPRPPRRSSLRSSPIPNLSGHCVILHYLMTTFTITAPSK
jgi:hypothetical protein